MTEPNLSLQRACQGDVEAFNRLVLAYQDLVFLHTAWMLADSQAAEQVTQHTFLLAFEELRTFPGGDFSCWLLKIANRLCLEALRRRKPGSPPSPRLRPGSLPGGPGQAVVRAGLQRLPPDLRAVVTLVDLQEMDYRQAAGILGISAAGVSARLARARLQLREALTPSRR